MSHKIHVDAGLGEVAVKPDDPADGAVWLGEVPVEPDDPADVKVETNVEDEWTSRSFGTSNEVFVIVQRQLRSCQRCHASTRSCVQMWLLQLIDANLPATRMEMPHEPRAKLPTHLYPMWLTGRGSSVRRRRGKAGGDDDVRSFLSRLSKWR